MKEIFIEKNRNILLDESLYKSKWQSIEHDFLEYKKFPSISSDRSIQFIVTSISALKKVGINRLQKFCVFYLLLIIEMGNPNERKQALEHLILLLSEEEMKIIRFYWPKIGLLRYLPDRFAYVKRWERILRDEQCFFNIDFTLWIFVVDRFLVTFKYGGWLLNKICESEAIWYKDVIHHNLVEMLRLHQEVVKERNRIFLLPKIVNKMLHPNSRIRFDKEFKDWVRLDQMPYDPNSKDLVNSI